MKGIILSTHPTVTKWKTLSKKLAFFDRIYNSGIAGNVWEPWTLETVNVKPVVDVNGKINRQWLADLQKPYFDNGYDYVKFHYSLSQKKKWGIKNSLRGSNPNNSDEAEYMYFAADENTKRNGLNAFEQVGGHEGGHGYYDKTGETDITHVWHERNPDISGLFKLFDWSKYQPDRMTLRKIWLLLKKTIPTIESAIKRLKSDSVPSELHPRLLAPHNEYISQGYGAKNSIYKLTGRHIGVDYACPIGTPVYAPWDGEVTVSGEHATLGKFCYFEYEWQGKKRVERWLHLNEIPERGKYKRGREVAYSGNTGFSTGPHFHVDGWWDEVNIGMINKTNWDKLTYNPVIE